MIKKKPQAAADIKPAESIKDEARIDAFIARAPDSGVAAKAVKSVKQNKVQISLTIDPDLLDRIDARAAKIGMARAATMTLAFNQFLEHGAVIEGEPDR